MQKYTAIIIAGPTASGKSALAIDVAEAFEGIIINADSMQVYKDSPVLSACPSDEDKNRTPHKLYEIYESSHQGTVAEWVNVAAEEIKKAWDSDKVPVIVGGSGMYIDILINGMSPIPETSKKSQETVAKILQENSVQKLHQMLGEVDPITAEKLSENDTTRIRRAYEVFLDTGKTISSWHNEKNIKILPQANFFIIKITPSAQELDEASFGRFDKMIAMGAIEEAKKIKALNLNPNLPAMKALGVPELIDYISGKISLTDAVSQAKLHTRQYAKRQRTWFNNKLKADIVLEKCYRGDKNLVKELKNILHKST